MKLLQDSLVTNFSISLVSKSFSALLMLQILGQDFTEIRFWLKPPESFDIVFFFVLRMFLQLPIWELLAVVINQGQKFANL
jgi:hypothetical protein